MLDSDEIYVVVDIEADGPVPGLFSMLSIAAVATNAEENVSEFYQTVQPLDEASQDPDTMQWWQGQPEAWKEVTTNPQNPEMVMKDFVVWVKNLGATAIFVAHAVALDYTFVSWYLQKFAGEDPFRNEKNVTRTLDIRSFIAGKFGLTLNLAHRKNLPSKLTEGMPDHSHKAIDDARGYAVMLRNILKTSKLND